MFETDYTTSFYGDNYDQDGGDQFLVASPSEGSLVFNGQHLSEQLLVLNEGGCRSLRSTVMYWGRCCSCGSAIVCLHSRPCLFFFYVIVVFVLLSSLVSLVIVAVLIVEPYKSVSRFVNATCSTRNVSYGREEQSCSCGKGCNSKYKCIRIRVMYQDVAGVKQEAVLYEDETALGRQVRTFIIHQYKYT